MGAPTPSRLVSFSDNVISVILTIMVLNLSLPARDGLGGLREMMPAVGIYLLSFSFTGVYWLNHQQLTRRLHAASYYLQIANLSFLFCLSLLPFSTSYLIHRHTNFYNVQQYAATLLPIATTFYAIRQATHLHLEVDGRMTAFDIQANKRHRLSLLVYLLCILSQLGTHSLRWWSLGATRLRGAFQVLTAECFAGRLHLVPICSLPRRQ